MFVPGPVINSYQIYPQMFFVTPSPLRGLLFLNGPPSRPLSQTFISDPKFDGCYARTSQGSCMIQGF